MKAQFGITKLVGVCLSALLATPVMAAPPTTGFAPSLFLDSTELTTAELPKRAKAGGISGSFNNNTLKASKITLNLPDGREVRAKRTRETQRAGGTQTWLGEFEGLPGSLLVMTQHRGLVSGFAYYKNETWEIQAIEKGRSKLFRVDESLLPGEGPLKMLKDVTGSTTTNSSITPATAAEPVTQDLLVVYTPAIATQYGGADALRTQLLSAIDAANAAYTNSQIGIRLNLLDMRQIDYVETGDMNVSLSALQSTSDGKMDQVHTWRDQLGADLVSLLTTDSNYCGIAYLAGASGNPASAFSVVSPSCFSNHSFAHEVGHNQGNHHDRADASGSAAYPYSYGYRTCDYPSLANGQAFRTVMAYSCVSTPRVNQFSNPNLYYNNAAQMGISYDVDPANASDNARSMNNTASVIAAYRSGPVTLPAAPSNLNVSSNSFDTANVSWTDNSNNETGFVLQRADSSGSFVDRVTLSSNTTSFSDTGLSGNSSYSYRVRSYNSAGVSSYSNSITITTSAAPLPPTTPSPASVKLVTTTATVTWANVAGENGYELVRETYNARKGTWGASTTNVAANVTSQVLNLANGSYRFKVRAYNGSGYSTYTTVACTGITGCGSDGSFTVKK